MAYFPISSDLMNGSVLTQDHIRHIENGIRGAELYADHVVATVQSGQIAPAVLDEAIDRAVADGRIPTGDGVAEPVAVTETAPGVYELTGLTVTETAPGVYQIGA